MNPINQFFIEKTFKIYINTFTTIMLDESDKSIYDFQIHKIRLRHYEKCGKKQQSH